MAIETIDGHDKPCYYCAELCDGLSGDPGKWPIRLTHKDEPGVMKYHHTKCVQMKLIENASTIDLFKELMKRYDDDSVKVLPELLLYVSEVDLNGDN